ncbi:MAG: 50S ribosomal protein L3 [Candidatus Berkelbacteria bacterium]|nr:50S ribosomal protein L3 [Candidatus Berkelbacteria bacterium]
MKILVGKKLGMTRVFDQNEMVRAVTAVEAKPTEIFEILEPKKVGYSAVKVKIQNRKKTKLMEFRADEEIVKEFKVGDIVSVEKFEIGDFVKVIGQSKGKGFAGTIKRYHFVQGPKSHGSNQQRRVGSIGAGYPQHVIKGQRMPGHKGDERVTTKNLEILAVDAKENIMLIAGAIPGKFGSEVRIIG